MKYCPNCRVGVSAQGNLCPWCGETLQDVEEPPKAENQSREVSSSSEELSLIAWLVMVLIPLICFVYGAVLMAKGKANSGVAYMAVACVLIAVYTVFLCMFLL